MKLTDSNWDRDIRVDVRKLMARLSIGAGQKKIEDALFDALVYDDHGDEVFDGRMARIFVAAGYVFLVYESNAEALALHVRR